MATNKNYWKQRVLSNEEYVNKIAKTYSANQVAYYKKAYKEITAELNKYYACVLDGTVSRTQLWNYSRYRQLLDIIADNCSEIGRYQTTSMDEMTEKVFEETLGRTLDSMKTRNISFVADNDVMRNKVLHTNWSGSNYSQRIWTNTNELASRLQSDIESMIAIGKSPTEIKLKIADDFNVSARTADRLIRTEASYVYNATAVESYKQAGCSMVEFLAEADACDVCRSYDGKQFIIGTEPTIPVHPNCRCCYLPVIR